MDSIISLAYMQAHLDARACLALQDHQGVEAFAAVGKAIEAAYPEAAEKARSGGTMQPIRIAKKPEGPITYAQLNGANVLPFIKENIA